MPSISDPPSRYLGYLKYDGVQVTDGIIDARAASLALDGFDTALRYFLSQENREIGAVALPVPVSIERGSWTAFIPENVGAWITAVLAAGSVIYASTAAKKMAENDFKNVGLTSLFRKSLEAMQWAIRIAKHMGDFTRRRIQGVTWKNNNLDAAIPNDRGEVLLVPREYFETYLKTPRSLLKNIVSVVEEERTLKIGTMENGKIEEVEIKRSEKHIFVTEDQIDSEVLFPDLKHGQQVTLDGLVTKGNEKENSIGFEYQNHVLTCYPRTGSIVRFKPHLFLHCRIYGEINREDDHGGFDAPRPKITFDNLTILNSEQPELF
jgi:hypothetical protein